MYQKEIYYLLGLTMTIIDIYFFFVDILLIFYLLDFFSSPFIVVEVRKTILELLVPIRSLVRFLPHVL